MFPYYKGRESAEHFNIGYDDILAMYELYSEYPRSRKAIFMSTMEFWKGCVIFGKGAFRGRFNTQHQSRIC